MLKRNQYITVDFHASAESHIGLVRRSNQDRYFVGRLPINAGSRDEIDGHTCDGGVGPCNHDFYLVPDGGSLLIVADGVGGNVYGEGAAEIAVRSFVSFMNGCSDTASHYARDEEVWKGLMRLGIEHYQKRIFEHQALHPKRT